MFDQSEESTQSSFGEESYRIQKEYARRDSTGKKGLYSWTAFDNLINQYHFQRTCIKAISSVIPTPIDNSSFLDVGCGKGIWLRTLLEWGADPGKLHGIDLLEDRIQTAMTMSPHLDFQVASGWPIPFADRSMDVCTAHTVFSSILDGDGRMALASEMQRVVKKNGGIVIYDFRISHPRNPATIGIRKSEIKRIFPDMNLKTRSITLAPPINRTIC